MATKVAFWEYLDFIFQTLIIYWVVSLNSYNPLYAHIENLGVGNILKIVRTTFTWRFASDNQNFSNYKSINSMQFIVTSFNVLWNKESEKKYYPLSSLTQIDFYTSQQCCPLYILSYYIVSHCIIFILVFSIFFFQPLCQKILFILLISVLYFGVFFALLLF